MEIEAIEPHGLCSGVNAAIAKALVLRNVYCLHELVHNEIIIDELKRLGYRFVKRAFDIVFSGLVIVVGFIPGVILSFAIAKDTGGSPMYTQYRYGKRGRKFKIYKFRTMALPP